MDQTDKLVLLAQRVQMEKWDQLVRTATLDPLDLQDKKDQLAL